MGMRRHTALATGMVVVGVLTVTGCSGNASSPVDQSATPPPSPPSAASGPALGSIPAGDGPIDPGRYSVPSSAWSVADFEVTFPEDWTVQYGHIYARHMDQDDEFGFYAVVVDEIFAEGCAGSNAGLTEFGPSVDDLAQALLQQPGPEKSGPVKTTFAGYPATRIDLTVPKGFDLAPCNAPGVGLQIWYSQPADKNFVLLKDGVASVYIVDVDGERQVFLTQYRSATSAKDLAELQTVLDSITIKS